MTIYKFILTICEMKISSRMAGYIPSYHLGRISNFFFMAAPTSGYWTGQIWRVIENRN